MVLRQVLLATLIQLCGGADILLISSASSISHSRWYGKLAFLLANHGHQVVVLDTDQNFFQHPNITHRMMDGSYGWLKIFEQQVEANPEGLNSMVESNSIWEDMMLLADPSFFGCDVLLKSQGTKKFIEEFRGTKFDLIIADGFCESFYGFVSVFGNPPLIPACPYLEVIAADFVGLYDNPAYAPFHLSSYSPKMNFFERLRNSIYHILNQIVIRNVALPNSDSLMKEVFGPSVPKLADILQSNVALIMTGYNKVIEGAKPLPPNYIPIPAFHAGPPLPLPENLAHFLDGAKDGAILFSMGSNFKSVLMSEEKIKMFLSVFRDIPQRVIWKLEVENRTDVPPNVMITKWLPQNDILGHPKVRAFISHGGLLGTQEAVYHGVPVLGLPLLYDQVHNMERLERHGVGVRLYYKQLDARHFSHQIHTIIHDPSYMNNMKKLSAAFRDTPETSQERALFWIEYVLRNADNNNRYIKSASTDLYCYQRLLLDLLAFVAMCFVILYALVKCVVGCVSRLIFGSTRNYPKKKIQ